MPFESGDKAFNHDHLHHAGTISPDGSGWFGSADDDITAFNGPYPFPAFNAAFDPPPAPPAGSATSAADAGGTTGGGATAAPAAQAGADSSSGLVIDALYDSSITNLATSNPTLYADVTGAISAAIEFYETTIANPITLDINFGYGEVNGVSLGGSTLGESSSHDSLGFASYSTVRSILSAAATSADDVAAINSLPTTDPTSGGEFFIADAQLKALGFSVSGTDGAVGLSSTASFDYDPSNRAVAGEYDAVGVLEHEISEVMGRLESLSTLFGSTNEYTILDLFRYASAGTRDLTPGPGYFSIDGGTTDLAQFNNPNGGGDAGDWGNSVTDDSYDAFSFPGVANTVSATDLRVMDVLGYTLASAPTAPIVTAGGTVTFTGGGSAVTLDSGLVVSDASSTTLASGTVIIGGFISGDTLTVGMPGGLATSFSNGTLTLTGTASLATYRTALESVTYGFNPTNGDPTGGGSHTSRTIAWSVNDGVASSNAGSSTLDTIHAAPTATAGASVSYTENDTPVALDPGLSVSDPDSGGKLTGATVSISSGFLSGDTLHFTDQKGISGGFNGTGTLTLTGTASIADYQTALQSVSYSFVGDPTNGGADPDRTIIWTVTDGADASSAPVTSSLALTGVGGGGGGAPCYCEGTGILTDRGDVAVEDLRIGDRVVTHAGALRSICWIGRRHIDLTRHPTPKRVRPIVIHASAVADGVPRRDLRVSPDHAVLFGGTLVLARLLINGASIDRDIRCHSMTYYHIELATHDILLAEGLPAESYLDTGNRRMFENADVPLVLHPDFDDAQRLRIARSCRPLATDAAGVEPIWRCLANRATLLGLRQSAALPTTDDPGLHLVGGGRTIKPTSADAGRYTFALPRVHGPLRLLSRAARPCDTRPWVQDGRSLGVAVSRLTLKYGAEVAPIALDHPLLSHGWWVIERDRDSFWRWTDGDALLPLLCDRPVILEVELAQTLDYPVAVPTQAEAAA